MELPYLRDMTSAELAEAADANLVAHTSWVERHLEGMRVEIDDELVVVDSGLTCDTFNVVCRARLAESTARDRLTTVVEYFRSVSRPFSWWVGPADRPENLGELLVRAGLEATESELAMAADLDAIHQIDLSPQGLRIERVKTRAQIKQYATINAANWDPPDRDVIEFFERATPVLLARDAPLWLYLGYLGEQSVASAELTVAGGVAGLYGISTLAPFRRRGIGSAMTVRPLIDATAAGYRTAVLQAAPDGIGVYTRVGFVPTGRITEYKPAVPC
jgi:ribosomal protein S18 acetylase RimI-like enzyme